jgi:hypothetical protein
MALITTRAGLVDATEHTTVYTNLSSAVPVSVDWHKRGAVTPAKN